MIRVARLAGLLPLTAHLRLEDTLAQFAAPLREQVGFFRVSGIILHLRVFRAARATRHPSGVARSGCGCQNAVFRLLPVRLLVARASLPEGAHVCIQVMMPAASCTRVTYCMHSPNRQV